MTAEAVARNAAAALWLAERLALWGLTDATDRAEFVCRELLAMGMRPVEPPVPLRPNKPPASAAVRENALRAAADAVRRAKDSRKTDARETVK